jgi:ArsR family transcriptional regulator
MPPAAEHDLAIRARLFHALADETRLRIIAELVDGELCVCDLTDSLRTAQSRLSFHLKTLKDAGLVRDRRDGRWVYYSLDRERFAALHDSLHDIAGNLPGVRRAFSSCK